MLDAGWHKHLRTWAARGGGAIFNIVGGTIILVGGVIRANNVEGGSSRVRRAERQVHSNARYWRIETENSFPSRDFSTRFRLSLRPRRDKTLGRISRWRAGRKRPASERKAPVGRQIRHTVSGVDIERKRLSPLRGLMTFSNFVPGADAPGYSLSPLRGSSSRSEA